MTSAQLLPLWGRRPPDVWRAVGATLLLLLFIAPARSADRQAVLAEMQVRGILAPTQSEWSQDDWTLLWKLKKAEAEGAVDSLIKKMRRIRSYVVTIKRPDGTQKLLLTPAGYERYHFIKSQDAIHVFESRGIAVKSVFHLTDLTGRFFFDSAGGLTDEGEAAYDAIARGEAPLWKFDWEPIPEKALPKEMRGDPPEILALKRAGMVELSDEEENWLLETTRCSENELESESSFRSVADSWRRKPRYFMSPQDPVFALVARYRGGDHSIQGLGGTATFGKGGGLCR